MDNRIGGENELKVFSVSWACLLLYPDFYKGDYFAILKTSSTCNKLKISMDLADPKIMIDQSGSREKHYKL